MEETKGVINIMKTKFLSPEQIEAEHRCEVPGIQQRATADLRAGH